MRFALLALLIAPALMAQTRLVEGNAASRVRILVYEDLQCPDCADFRKMLDEKLLPKYGSQVAVEHRDFPLAKHKWAMPAAVASRYFQQQDAALAVRFRQWAMSNQKSITQENFESRLTEFAKANGSDPAKVSAALADAALQKLVQADLDEGVARGVAHTPTVFVDGEAFIETFSLEEISKGIDEAIARAKQ
jgi:protein-disulfide isomerase